MKKFSDKHFSLFGVYLVMRKKVGLVLGAGGARGFCHIGVLEVLQEAGIPIDIVTGCSMGAMIGGGFVAGVSCAQMRERANRVTMRQVFDIDILNLRSKGGLARGNRAMKIAKQFVGETRIEDCLIPFCAIATDLRSHSLYTFRTGPVYEAIRASISIPGVFHPVHYHDRLLVDGGLLKRMPIQEARDLGADIIIAVDAIGPPNELSSTSTLGILDISYQVIDWRSAQYEGKEADVLIVPQMGSRSSLVFRRNEEAIQAGREATLKALSEIKKLL